MRNPFNFFIELFNQPIWISMWVFYLMVVNMVSLIFWQEPIAKIIFITFIASAMIMMGLYSKYGFEKVLGLGHILWIPLSFYIVISFPISDAMFHYYLVILLISILISLAFDIADVWKYFSTT